MWTAKERALIDSLSKRYTGDPAWHTNRALVKSNRSSIIRSIRWALRRIREPTLDCL